MELKKYTPFIFPAIALLIVALLAWRWYDLRTQRDQMENAPVEVEQLTEEEVEIIRGVDGATEVELETPEDEVDQPATASGQIRYRLKDERVLLNISANLEEVEQGGYQAWFKKEAALRPSKAFVLEMGKGGYMGSAAIGQDQLPLEVIVSRELDLADDNLEQEVLRGQIEVVEDQE